MAEAKKTAAKKTAKKAPAKTAESEAPAPASVPKELPHGDSEVKLQENLKSVTTQDLNPAYAPKPEE